MQGILFQSANDLSLVHSRPWKERIDLRDSPTRWISKRVLQFWTHLLNERVFIYFQRQYDYNGHFKSGNIRSLVEIEQPFFWDFFLSYAHNPSLLSLVDLIRPDSTIVWKRRKFDTDSHPSDYTSSVLLSKYQLPSFWQDTGNWFWVFISWWHRDHWSIQSGPYYAHGVYLWFNCRGNSKQLGTQGCWNWRFSIH